MLTDHSHQLLRAAATKSLERIREDRAKAPQRLKPLLAYIEEHLFDPTLDVNQLKRSCGVRDNSVPIQFHSAVGRPPHGYIEDRRLETACRLLADTDLKIWQISELLGYSSIQVFSRAFSRWAGQRPTLYRKKARRRAGKEAEAAVAAGEERFFSTESLRRALAGDLPSEDAGLLIQRLLRLYPSCRDAVARAISSGGSGHGASDDDEGGLFSRRTFGESGSGGALSIQLSGGEIDRLQAEEVLLEIEKQPLEKKRATLSGLRLTSPTLFHLLREKSREIGRDDPQRGIEYAELALDALEGLAKHQGDGPLVTNLRAQGWVSLASARCFASDFLGAEQGFMEAERSFRAGGRDPEIEAEIALNKASLRRDQRRFQEARDLVDRALTLYRQLGREDQVDKALIVEATVVYEEGDPAAAIPYLEHALERMGKDSEGIVQQSLYHNLVTAYVESGRYSDAVELLPQARQLTADYGKAYHKIRLRWLDGVISRELEQYDQAESRLLEARDAFANIDSPIDASLVCLDLAELYRRQGRSADLEQLSASMVPLFTGLQQHREALVSLKLFHQAAAEQRVTSMMLEKARVALLNTQRRRV